MCGKAQTREGVRNKEAERKAGRLEELGYSPEGGDREGCQAGALPDKVCEVRYRGLRWVSLEQGPQKR